MENQRNLNAEDKGTIHFNRRNGWCIQFMDTVSGKRKIIYGKTQEEVKQKFKTYLSNTENNTTNTNTITERRL